MRTLHVVRNANKICLIDETVFCGTPAGVLCVMPTQKDAKPDVCRNEVRRSSGGTRSHGGSVINNAIT